MSGITPRLFCTPKKHAFFLGALNWIKMEVSQNNFRGLKHFSLALKCQQNQPRTVINCRVTKKKRKGAAITPLSPTYLQNWHPRVLQCWLQICLPILFTQAHFTTKSTYLQFAVHFAFDFGTTLLPFTATLLQFHHHAVPSTSSARGRMQLKRYGRRQKMAVLFTPTCLAAIF